VDERARAARCLILDGSLRGTALASELAAVPWADRDAWVDAVLAIAEPPPDVALPRGGVPYLPCGVAEILAAVADVPIGPEDEVVDLGAGLGRVLLLGHLLTGARGHGIEIQDALVAAARASAEALGLGAAVTFECGDAREVSLRGSVFFLYAPFNGEMLAAVVERLAALATRVPFSVCAVDVELPEARWAVRRPSSNARVAIYRCSGMPC
jgi:SAM-dependent methyltransferase